MDHVDSMYCTPTSVNVNRQKAACYQASLPAWIHLRYTQSVVGVRREKLRKTCPQQKRIIIQALGVLALQVGLKLQKCFEERSWTWSSMSVGPRTAQAIMHGCAVSKISEKTASIILSLTSDNFRPDIEALLQGLPMPCIY